jgi:hypothetical protein
MGALLLTLLASTPAIDAFVAGCARPVAAFDAPPRRGPAVAALADGVVVEASPTRLVVAHCFLENHEVRTARAVVEPLTRALVKEGDLVTRGQRLGEGAKATTLVDGEPAAAFVAARQRLLVPAAQPVLVVVDVDGHRAVRFEHGQPTHEWELARGQAEGVKEQRGDLKTPRGLYDVVGKSLGPFAGDYADYYGGVWLKVNYPNAFDAARGLDAGLVSTGAAAAIARDWRGRRLTAQGTKLGGGIGFHGWIDAWDGDAGWGLSWGCLVLHPEEARGFYDLVPVGTPIVLL